MNGKNGDNGYPRHDTALKRKASKQLLHHFNVRNGLKTVSASDWSQLSQLFNELQGELSTLADVSQNSKITNTLEGISHIFELTEEEHKTNTVDLETPRFKNTLATMSFYDLEGIWEIIEHGDKEEKTPEKWTPAASIAGMQTVNPIRKIVDQLDMSKVTKEKEFISVSIGDPTKYPNLKPCQSATESLINIVRNEEYNGYGPSSGLDIAKEALVDKYKTSNVPNMKTTNVFLASGCSDALNMSIASLCNADDIILLPKPGFTLYEVICKRYGIVYEYYNCLPDKDWEIDLNHLESLILSKNTKNNANNANNANKAAYGGMSSSSLAQASMNSNASIDEEDGNNNINSNKNRKKNKRIKGILVNNPSNPCGSVLSEENLRGVLALAEKYKIPLISDEVYANMTFNKCKFLSLGSLTTTVPVLVVSGLAKQYLVPGWRLGWIIVYDPSEIAKNICKSLQNLTTLILGPNTCVQASLPSIFLNTPDSYYSELNELLGKQANMFYFGFLKINGLLPIKPNGAMYLLTRIEIKLFNNNVIKNDIDFANKLLEEQAVLVLPGSIFGAPNYFRTVILPPENIIKDVIDRVREFCKKYITK